MTKNEQLIADLDSTFKNCLETAKRKNSDYGCKDEDPFANFRKSLVIGVSVEKAFLVRMLDKISRISTLLEKDALVEESITDTCDDLINYTALLKAFILSNGKQ